MSGEQQNLTDGIGAPPSEIGDLRKQLQQVRADLLASRALVANLNKRLKVVSTKLLAARAELQRRQDAVAQAEAANAEFKRLRATIGRAEMANAALHIRYRSIIEFAVRSRSAPIRRVMDGVAGKFPRPVRQAMKSLCRSRVATPLAALPTRETGDPAMLPRPAAGRPEVNPAQSAFVSLAEKPAAAASRVLGNTADIGSHCVGIGIVAYHTPLDDLRRCIVSARSALARCGSDVTGEIRVLDNGGTLTPHDLPDGIQLERAKNPGFAGGHNLCMQSAFDNGATVYLAAKPGGAWHPNCLRNLLAMHHAQDERAIIEARRFPEESAKLYDPAELTTPFVSATCMLIPRQIWQQTGGFDPNFFLYCASVDFSWRCRTLGFKTLICPSALFWHDISMRPFETWRRGAELVAARYLAYKWGDQKFMAWTENSLIDAGFVNNKVELPPLDDLPTMPTGSGIAEFRFGLHFAPTRW